MFVLSTSQRKDVYTTSEAKQSNVLGNQDPLKPDKTKNNGDNTKEDESEKSKEKLKDISNTDKETYELTLKNRLQ